MDAGPIAKQIHYPLQGHEKATELLQTLFTLGTAELVRLLPSALDGSITTFSQDDSLAIPAPKLSSNDSYLDFSQLTAVQCHNRCRAYAGWPGTWTYFQVGDNTELIRIKVLTTVVLSSSPSDSVTRNIDFIKQGGIDMLRVVLGDGSVLGVIVLQPANKKEMDAKAYKNGLRGAKLTWTTQ